jgi:hypothetical protein
MPTSSQGNSLIAGATKISIKGSRSSKAGDNKLDSSTLSLAHGSYRTYEDGLVDLGPSGDADGIVYTATANGYGTPPGAGATLSYGGKTLYCTESSEDASVGELMGWSASYTSDYTPPEE